MIQFGTMFSGAKRIITLTTDFGLEDPYVGAMKGVILNISPEATVVDITHLIQSYDIVEAALVLRSSYSFFPPGTIHVVVVDPGVGSSRRPILLTTEKYFFVAPDNGVLWPVRALARQPEAFHLTATEYFLKPVSTTFHGRDIFSPVAAWLSKGIDPMRLGKRISNLQELKLQPVRKIDEKQMIGTVLRTDKFGNLITNVSRQDLSLPGKDLTPFVIRFAGRTITQLRSSYTEASPGELFAIWGSLALLEISANQASAADILQADTDQEFVVELHS